MITPAAGNLCNPLRVARTFCLFLLAQTALSCTRSGDGLPPPPLPPVDSSAINAFINFGTLISLKDTMKVYDARTGNLVMISNPYGVLKAAAVNNTTVSDSLVYQPTVTRLLAMNYKTGMMHFLKYFCPIGYSFGGVSPSFPIIEGNRLYQGVFDVNGAFKLFCIDKVTGETIWEAEQMAAPDHEVYMPSIDQTSNSIVMNLLDGPASFDKTNGKLIWRNNSSYEFRELDVHPLVYHDEKLFVTSREYRAVYAFDVKNGDLLWKTELPKDLTHCSGKMYTYQNNLYVFSRIYETNQTGFVLHCIDVNSGAISKSITLPLAQWYIQFYDEYFYCYENIDQTFFPQRISKYRLSTGAKIWSNDLAGGIYDGVVMTPAFIYCTETDPLNTSSWQRVNILDQQDGAILKIFPVNAPVNFAPVVVDSTGKTYQPARWLGSLYD